MSVTIVKTLWILKATKKSQRRHFELKKCSHAGLFDSNRFIGSWRNLCQKTAGLLLDTSMLATWSPEYAYWASKCASSFVPTVQEKWKSARKMSRKLNPKMKWLESSFRNICRGISAIWFDCIWKRAFQNIHTRPGNTWSKLLFKTTRKFGDGPEFRETRNSFILLIRLQSSNS